MSVEAMKKREVYSQFAQILSPLLSERLRAVGAAGCELAAEQAPAESAETAGRVQHAMSLRFEGVLEGHCFILTDGELADAATTATPRLIVALQAVCEPFAAALFADYGSLRVHFAEAGELPENTETVGHLVCSMDEQEPLGTPKAMFPSRKKRSASSVKNNEPLRIKLQADEQLQRALLRLARVVAAAEACGIHHGNLGLVMDVELNVTLRFGQRQLSLREVMDLSSGSVVELDREVDEPVELVLDGRVIARGEAVIVDGNYGVRVTEVLHPMVL